MAHRIKIEGEALAAQNASASGSIADPSVSQHVQE